MGNHAEHELPFQRSDSLQSPHFSDTYSLGAPENPVTLQDFKALNAQFFGVLALVLLGKNYTIKLVWPEAPQGLTSRKRSQVQTSPDGTRFPEYQEESQQTPPSFLFMDPRSSAWPLSSSSLLSSFYSLARVVRHRTLSHPRAPSMPSFAFSPALINARACL